MMLGRGGRGKIELIRSEEGSGRRSGGQEEGVGVGEQPACQGAEGGGGPEESIVQERGLGGMVQEGGMMKGVGGNEQAMCAE